MYWPLFSKFFEGGEMAIYRATKLEHVNAGRGIKIFMFCSTSFFSNQIQIDGSYKQNMNI